MTCTSALGCPQLNCEHVPTLLASAGFTCQNCVLLSGQIRCDERLYNAAEAKGGVCDVSSCTSACSCDTTKCQSNANTNQCERKSCAYSTAGLCGGDVNCHWDSTASDCNVNPCATDVEATCSANQRCIWAVQAGSKAHCVQRPCRAACAACKYGSATMCQSDSACTWNQFDAASGCTTKQCDSLAETACNANTACSFHVVSSKCVAKTCGQRTADQTSCEADDQCIFDGSACRNSCEYQSPTASSCAGDSMCQWDAKNSICRRECDALLDESRCQPASACHWSTDSKCLATCDLFTTSGSCPSQTCFWDAKLTQCRPTCDTVAKYGNTEANCQSSDACFWKDSTCKTKCFKKYTDQAQCAADTDCSYDARAGVCTQKPQPWRPDLLRVQAPQASRLHRQPLPVGRNALQVHD